jgi:serine/threonine-protein kinase RsbW
MVRLCVPGTLRYRNLAVRVVASSCKLVAPELQDTGQAKSDFDAEVISAFSEAFNNVAMHGYAGREAGNIEVEIELHADAITIRISDTGATFDPLSAPPPSLEQLPESGMGAFIIRSFMDSVSYVPGSPPETPNVLCLFKRMRPEAHPPLTTRKLP